MCTFRSLISHCVIDVSLSYCTQGEYPLASASAVERSESDKAENSASKRGRGQEVILTFSMQGMRPLMTNLSLLSFPHGFQFRIDSQVFQCFLCIFRPHIELPNLP